MNCNNRNQDIELLGVNICPLTVNELNSTIHDCIEKSLHAIILNVNVHALNLLFHDHKLRQFFNSSDTVFCDGAGVILGAKLLGHKIPERIT